MLVVNVLFLDGSRIFVLMLDVADYGTFRRNKPFVH